jgi:hypothetical protein
MVKALKVVRMSGKINSLREQHGKPYLLKQRWIDVIEVR